jgi:hypothetical protein
LTAQSFAAKRSTVLGAQRPEPEDGCSVDQDAAKAVSARFESEGFPNG